jgi:hypothetical protein
MPLEGFLRRWLIEVNPLRNFSLNMTRKVLARG